jgi:FkbM family methyltransferase
MQYLEHANTGLAIASSDGVVTEVIERGIREGWYELRECRAAEAVVGEQDRVLELGGGLGAVAAHVWRSCKPRSYEVYEPNPQLVPLLEATLAANGATGVKVHAALLSHDRSLVRKGKTVLNVSADFWGASTLPVVGAAVPTLVAVASFARAMRLHLPTVIICDIEGGEAALFADLPEPSRLERLRGERPLGDVHAIVMELHPDVIGQERVRAIEERLRRIGFSKLAQSETVATYSRTPRVGAQCMKVGWNAGHRPIDARADRASSAPRNDGLRARARASSARASARFPRRRCAIPRWYRYSALSGAARTASRRCGKPN